MKSIIYMLTLIIVLLTNSITSAQSADTVRLNDIQAIARTHYPLLKQKGFYQQIADNKVRELNSEYLPQAAITGSATLQSEVTKFPGQNALGYFIAPDQYAAGLEVKQNLPFDGVTAKQKQLERQNGELQSQQVEADLIKLKERVSQYFGLIYLQQENKAIQQLRIKELEVKMKRVKSAVENGAALSSNYLVLESEALTARQKIDEINYNLVSMTKSLSLLTGTTIDTSTVFIMQEEIPLASEIKRPEHKIFELQSSNLKLRESLIDRNNLPKLFVYGRGYYGRPGYNFLDNSFRTYGIIGAGLNWNLSNYYTSRRQKSGLHINNDLINSQKEIFDVNLQTTIIQQQEEISRLESAVISDQQIADARAKVRKISSSQLDNGVITSADYIIDLNADNQAQFNLQLHRVQLLIARENYNTTLGY